MDAPEGVRSVTGEVATAIPGVTFGGTFPRLAARAESRPAQFERLLEMNRRESPLMQARVGIADHLSDRRFHEHVPVVVA